MKEMKNKIEELEEELKRVHDALLHIVDVNSENVLRIQHLSGAMTAMEVKVNELWLLRKQNGGLI